MATICVNPKTVPERHYLLHLTDKEAESEPQAAPSLPTSSLAAQHLLIKCFPTFTHSLILTVAGDQLR